MKDLKTHAYFVLVVEKETIFRKMLKNNVIARLGGGCLIITVSPYPYGNSIQIELSINMHSQLL